MIWCAITAMKPVTRSELLALVRSVACEIDAASAGDVFSSSAWWLAFVEHVSQDDWAYAVLASGATSAGFLPVYRVGPGWAKWRGLSNFYTGQLSLPEAPLLVSALSGGQPSVAEVEFSPLSESDAARLHRAWQAQGWFSRADFAFGNWYLPSADLSFTQFMSQRPERLQNTWRRKMRPFDKGLTHRLQIVRDVEHVDAAMNAFEHVYTRSWKPAEAFPSFVRAWAKACAAQGWLRLGLAWVDGVPVAAQFWFTAHGRAFVFKLAYDEAYSRLSAGTVLSGHMFRECLEVDRVREIDYLSGDDAYKRDWMTHRRQRFRVTACNPRTAWGLWRGVRLAAGEWRARWRGRSAQGLLAPLGLEAAKNSERGSA
jgi:hypothetical protein